MKNRNIRSAVAVAAVVELMEDRRLMSVSVPAGYVWVETVEAPASNDTKTGPKLVSSINELDDGASYFLRAVGKYQLAHSPVTRYGDAGFYQYRTAPYAWTPSVRDTNLRVDGVADWGALDADDNHYGAYIIGDGTALETQILDSYYGDNAGLIDLEIYVRPELDVTSLSYDSVESGKHHDLIGDYDDMPYSGEHWLDGNEDGDAVDFEDQALPTAYVSGSTMTVDAKFKVKGLSSSSPTPSVEIRGTGSDGIVFDATQASVAGGYATATLTADTAFELETVKHFESFTIDWETSTDGGVSWQGAGETGNEISVLWKDPIDQETPLYYGMVSPTTVALAGAKVRADIISKDWAIFSDRIVEQPAEPKRAGLPQGRPERILTYWKSDYPKDANGYPTGGHNNNTARKMIQSDSGDGDCNAWVELFASNLGLMGIADNDMKLIEVTSWYVNALEGQENELRPLMLIKSFSFADNPANPRADGWSYADGEYTDEDGIAAQGNNNPIATVFRNHAILMLDNKFYDPSYGGVAHNNRASWELASLAGTKAKRIVDPQAAIPQFFIAAKKNVDNGVDEQDVVFKIFRGPQAGVEVGN